MQKYRNAAVFDPGEQLLLDGHRLGLLQAVQQVVLGCHLGEIIPMLKGKIFLFH